jgi:hypothetical protein
MEGMRINDDRGDAVMVTAVLLLSIFLTVGSNYLIEHGDNVGKEEDMVHATDIEDSFLNTRSSMSSLLKADDIMTVILERFTLGTAGNPYMAVARSSGSLVIDPESSTFQMSLVKESPAGDRELNNVNGALYYTANNYYFHDQDYHFTAGGVILEQYSSQVMTAPPDLMLVDASGSTQFHMDLFGITSSYKKLSGIESLPVSIRMAGSSLVEESFGAGETLSIRINGLGEKGWYDHMLTYLLASGLSQGVDFMITAPLDWDSTAEYVEIELLTIDNLVARIGEMEVTV